MTVCSPVLVCPELHAADLLHGDDRGGPPRRQDCYSASRRRSDTIFSTSREARRDLARASPTGPLGHRWSSQERCGGTMPGVIDGRFDDPDGRSKLFVRQRPDESGDDFATRAMGFLYAMSDGHVLDQVLASAPADWEIVPSTRWLEAVNSSEPRLRLRVTPLSSKGGGPVGHLVVECEDQLVADDLSLIHISEPTRQAEISYAVFCLKKKKKQKKKKITNKSQ